MTQADDKRAGVVRTSIGLVLIVAAAPVYIALTQGSKGSTVFLGGLAAFGVLIAGIVLAGGWLGVFRRRREQGLEQQGCLQLLLTLLTLLAGGVILYYVVFYGASVVLRGEF